jgi:hypothetical protein
MDCNLVEWWEGGGGMGEQTKEKGKQLVKGLSHVKI